MRDIRADLTERLEAIAGEKKRLQDRLASLDRQEDSAKALLADEEERWHGMQAQLFGEASGNGHRGDRSAASPQRTPMSNLILEYLADGREHTVPEIAKAAKDRNFPFGQKHPSRVVFFALVGMAQSKLVKQIDKQHWKIGEAGRENS